MEYGSGGVESLQLILNIQCFKDICGITNIVNFKFKIDTEVKDELYSYFVND